MENRWTKKNTKWGWDGTKIGDFFVFHIGLPLESWKRGVFHRYPLQKAMEIPHLPQNVSLMLSIFYPAMLCCPFSKLTAPERVISAFQNILPPKQGRSIFRISLRILRGKKNFKYNLYIYLHPAKCFHSSTPGNHGGLKDDPVSYWVSGTFHVRFGVQGAAGWTMTPAVCSRRHSLKSSGWKDNTNVPDRGLRCKGNHP